MSQEFTLPKLRTRQPVWPLHSTEVLTPDGVVLNVITGVERHLPDWFPKPMHAGVDPDDPWCYVLGYVRPEVAARAEALVAAAELKNALRGGDES